MKKLFLFTSIILVSVSVQAQNLLVNYTFSDYSGDTVLDNSGHNNNGLLVGKYTVDFGTVKFTHDTIGYLQVPPIIDGLNDFSIYIKALISHYNTVSIYPVNTFFSASTPGCTYCFGLDYDKQYSQWELTMNGVTHVFPQVLVTNGNPIPVNIIRNSGIVTLNADGDVIGTFSDAIPLHATTFIFGQREQCPGDCFNNNRGIRGGFNRIQIADAAVYLKESDDLTTASSLSVFPDPFTSSATITFSSPQQSTATIALYDLAGRKVQTVFEGTVEAGDHNIELKRNELSAGVYLLQLRVNDDVRTEKIIIE